MKKILLFVGISLSLLTTGCDEKPSLAQTIAYLEHKIDKTNYYGAYQSVQNEIFKIENNKVYYSVVMNGRDDDYLTRNIYKFNLNDIYTASVGISGDIGYIEVSLTKFTADFTSEPLNEYTKEQFIKNNFPFFGTDKNIQIWVDETELEEIQKAFLNIRDEVRKNRGDSYFDE